MLVPKGIDCAKSIQYDFLFFWPHLKYHKWKYLNSTTYVQPEKKSFTKIQPLPCTSTRLFYSCFNNISKYYIKVSNHCTKTLRIINYVYCKRYERRGGEWRNCYVILPLPHTVTRCFVAIIVGFISSFVIPLVWFIKKTYIYNKYIFVSKYSGDKRVISLYKNIVMSFYCS